MNNKNKEVTTIVFWNAQSLNRKKRLLQHFLQEKKVDIMLISETKLTGADRFKIPNYLSYRKDEKTSAGVAYRGLMVLVHRAIIHQPIPPEDLNSIQALGVLISVAGKTRQVFATYRPPNSRLEIPDLNKLMKTATPTIIAGDLNVKHPHWNSKKSCQDGKRLYDDAMARNYDVMGPLTPTHYNSHGGCEIIDVAIVKDVNKTVHLTTLPDLPSDHRPVMMTIHETPCKITRPPKRGKTCWDTYQQEIYSRTSTRPIQTAEDVEAATQEITTAIRESLQISTHTSAPGPFPGLPAWIKDLIREKRDTRLLWQQTRCPTLKTALNALVEKVRQALQEHDAATWDEKIESITDDMPSVHKTCRELSGTGKSIQPLMAEDGTPRFLPQERAEMFAAALRIQFTPNPTTNVTHKEMVEKKVKEYLESPPIPAEKSKEGEDEEDEPKLFFRPGWVKWNIKKLPNRKAPGLDTIPNEAIKNLPPKAVVALTRIYNGILRSGHFPTSWKIGKVVMIPKPGKDPRKPTSYRPITLLSCLSKLFEKLILQRLLPHIKPRKEQYGFRAEHSTTLQVTRMIHEMVTAYNKKEHTAAVFLDMEKAFDRVWHEGLLYKLSTSTAPKRIVQIIASFLQNRTFVVAVEEAISQPQPIEAGVPQGSTLSPVCYSWYTDDFPVVGQAQLALYADDAAIFAASLNPAYAVKRLTPTLEALPEWLDKWRMAVNVGKSQAILIGRKHPPAPPVLMGQNIDWNTSVKYLGVTIDRRLNFEKHITTSVGRAKGARALLSPLLRSKLPLRTKLAVYKLYIRSRLTYAGPAWYAQISKRQKQKLQTQENITLRQIVGAPRMVRNATICKDLRHRSIDAFIKGMAGRMFQRADKSLHPHLKKLAPLHARPPDRPGKRRDKPLPREIVPLNSDEEEEEEDRDTQ